MPEGGHPPADTEEDEEEDQVRTLKMSALPPLSRSSRSSGPSPPSFPPPPPQAAPPTILGPSLPRLARSLVLDKSTGVEMGWTVGDAGDYVDIQVRGRSSLPPSLPRFSWRGPSFPRVYFRFFFPPWACSCFHCSFPL
jgi:hypothetical protein